MALKGTVFIDEISEAPLSVQVKLLRVLQEKQFSRLGSDSLITADFRLITASNKHLATLVQRGEFRQDLYYRINILELALPALRERSGDIMPIVKHTLAQQGKKRVFTHDAVDFLKSYSWPGNIRELQAMVYRLVVLLNVDIVDKNILQPFIPSLPLTASASLQTGNDDITLNETDLLKNRRSSSLLV